MPSSVIFSQTSVANTAVDTGPIPLQKYGPIDSVMIEVVPSGAMTTGNIQLFDPDASAASEMGHFASGVGTTPVFVSWGVSCGTAAVANTGYLGGLSAPLPPRVQFKVPGLGAGVTALVRVIVARQGRS